MRGSGENERERQVERVDVACAKETMMRPERRVEEKQKREKLQKNIFNKASAGPGSVVCAKVG